MSAPPEISTTPADDSEIQHDLSLNQMSLAEAHDVFSRAQIQRLHRRFAKLHQNSESGSIPMDDFLSIPEIAANPLVERIFHVLDKNKDNTVDFEEFIEGLSIFSLRGEKEKKWMFCFEIYDMDNDGFISNGELFQVLSMMVGDNLTDEQLQQVVDKTIAAFDLDKDGKISFDEFKQAVAETQIEEKMVIKF